MPKRLAALTAMVALLAGGAPSLARAQAAFAVLQVDLVPDPGNPASPRMGDRMLYRSTIRNTGASPVQGVVAWVSLVQVDPGREQPVDLEDWSAHKAEVLPALAPGQSASMDWPMRLIASGHYRVVVSAAAGEGALSPSRFVDLAVRQKPVVESGRVLPVALGMPALLLGGLLVRWHRSKGGAA